MKNLRKLRQVHKGYVMILMAVFVSLILFAAKVCVDFSTQQSVDTEVGKRIYKKCGEQAALAVAKKWNPGLSLKEQKESMLRIADEEIYNPSPCYSDSKIGAAIPGISIPEKIQIKKGGKFDPLSVKKVKYFSLSPSLRTVQYHAISNDLCRTRWSANFSPSELYRRVYFLEKKPYVIDEDAVTDCLICSGSSTLTCLNCHIGADSANHVKMSYIMATADIRSSNTYRTRINPNDDKVQISVEDDKIKVNTDGNVGYAKPAQCNIDMILAIPTNMAACNKDNLDVNTPTTGTPQIVIGNTASPIDPETLAAKPDVKNFRATPIYEIAQAYRMFLKEHFMYTQGVNVGLIPYSGKISIPPERGDAWTDSFSQFVWNNAKSAPYLRGSLLYGTVGKKDGSLSTQYSEWGLAHKPQEYGGYGIMFRGKGTQESTYGGAWFYAPDILSNENPNVLKFKRFNYNPCYGGYANLLNMKCEYDCRKYCFNPYFMVELTSDVGKVYDVLNTVVPFNDQLNASNFLFLPITWAQNLLEDWTKDPGCEAVDTIEDSKNLGRLSSQSKLENGRKKAVILMVNKPDWFEPNELTYLGFDNDFSEIPMIESDKIDFSVNYSDRSKKFTDGSSFNGTIQGMKKILKVSNNSGVSYNTSTGYYECPSSGSIRLTFPKKYLVRIVVEAMIKWTKSSCNLHQMQDGANFYNMGRLFAGPIAGKTNQLVAQSVNGCIAHSSDGITWCDPHDKGRWGWYLAPVYGNGTWVVIHKDNVVNNVQTFTDVKIWHRHNIAGVYGENSFSFGNGIFMIHASTSAIYTSRDALTWNKVYTFPIPFARVMGYGNGRWICGEGEMYESKDNGKTWNLLDSSLKSIYGTQNAYWQGNYEWYGAPFFNGYFYAINASAGYVAISKNGANWRKIATLSGFHRNISVFNNELVVYPDSGEYVYKGSLSGSLQFTNISSSNGFGTGKYTFTREKEFFIEPNQIQGSDGNYYIDINLENVRLISAEITNRPYEIVTPKCKLNGTTIYTNVKKKVQFNVKRFAGSITFNNVNESSLSYTGTHSIGSNTVFNFSSSNFSNNYSMQKIKYSIVNADIITASLSLQRQRVHLGKNNCYRNNTMYNGNVSTSFSSGYGHSVTNICYWQGDCIVSDIFGIHERNKDWAINSYNWQYPDRIPHIRVNFTNARAGRLCIATSDSSDLTGYGLPQLQIYFDNKIHDIGSPGKSGIFLELMNINHRINSIEIREPYNSDRDLWYAVKEIVFENLDTISLGSYDSQYPERGLYLKDGYVCFSGQGDLSLTVAPVSGALTCTTPSGVSQTMTISSSDSQEITISPEEFLYEKIDNGEWKYKIALSTSKISLSDLKMLDSDPVVEFMKPRMPEMSRVVDFSKENNGNFVYNIAGTETGKNDYLVYGHNINGDINKVGIKWNSNGYWEYQISNNYSFSAWHHYIPFMYTGDLYLISGESNAVTGDAYYRFFIIKKDNFLYRYIGMECHREYLDLSYIKYANNIDASSDIAAYPFEVYNLKTSSIPIVMGGITLPINTALYWGMDGSEEHAYQWQSDSDGNLLANISPHEALKKVFKDACAKLKNTYGIDNVRIYIVTYRKQTQYKDKLTQQTANFDYSYLKADGVVIVSVQTANNTQDLKIALKNIANDIKSWAGYTEAKVVK